jgi:hypothetical protein
MRWKPGPAGGGSFAPNPVAAAGTGEVTVDGDVIDLDSD